MIPSWHTRNVLQPLRLGRSPEADDFIAKLNFYPLSIELLAHSIRDILQLVFHE